MQMYASVRRAKKLFFAALASLLTALLVITGFTAPAFAAEGDPFEITLTGALEQREGQPVLTAGDEYELALRYFPSQLTPGQEVFITIPDGVTIPDEALVIPNGNDAIAGLEPAGAGKLKLTIADPLPSVTEGVMRLKFSIEEVDESSKERLVWDIDGIPTTWEIVIKEPNDVFENVSDWHNKSQDAPNYRDHIDIVDGQIVVNESITDVETTYTLRYNTVEAVQGLVITDELDELLEVQAGSFTTSLVTWDADGLNRQVDTAVDLRENITSTGFTATVDLPERSELTVTYKATVKASKLTGLQEQLQAEYEKKSEDGGDFQVRYENTVTWDRDETETSNSSHGFITDHAPAPVGPDYGSAYAKSVDRKTVTDAAVTNETATGADLIETFDLTYTLNANLTEWADFEGERFELSQNVVLTDTLPAQVKFNAETLKMVDQDGTEVALALVEAPADPATEFLQDEYLLQYTIVGNQLFVNLGQDTSKHYTITFDATVENLHATSPYADLRNTIYRVTNSAQFRYGPGAQLVTRDAETEVVVPKDLSEGLDDPDVFSKKVATDNLTVPAAPETTAIPFTFTIHAGKADVTASKIYDRVDTNVFDVSDLDAIAQDIQVNYNWKQNAVGYHPTKELTPDHWILEMNEAGELEFSFTDLFATDLKEVSWENDHQLEVTLLLPLKPVVGKQTLEITNNARMSGAKDQVTYFSTAQTRATTYGDELEVKKTVYDAENDTYSHNLRVELDETGALVRDEFVYRIEVIPHGEYGALGFGIRDIVDLLPESMSLLGFVAEGAITEDVESIPVVTDDRYDLIGNLEAVKTTVDGRDVVTVRQKDGTLLNSTDTIALFIKVKVEEFNENVGIVNTIGTTSATITPTNDYPINIEKIDAVDPEQIISDRDARFILSDVAGEVVVDNIYVVDGRLVVADEHGDDKTVTVKEPGTYTLSERVSPQGYLLSNETLTVVVGEDGATAALRFYNTPGIDPVVSVGDYVWFDGDRDGIQGTDPEREYPIAGVTLDIIDPEGNPVLDLDGVPLTTVTDEHGWYEFANLRPIAEDESYTVRIVQDDPRTIVALEGLMPTQREQGTDRAVDSSDWEAASVLPLTEGGAHDPTLDFGFMNKTYAVGDVVWIDSNNDGLQDPSELTLPGVTVILTDAEGTEVARTVTDENGLYLFDNLVGGDYQIRFILTPDQAELYEFTSHNAGDDAADSDADPETGWTATITLDDANTALTTEYPHAAIEATRGIDPTWDAGVVLKDLPVDPETPNVPETPVGPETPVDPGTAVDPGTPVTPTEPEPEQPVVPVGPPLNELPVTGGGYSFTVLAGLGLLLLVLGLGITLVSRRKVSA